MVHQRYRNLSILFATIFGVSSVTSSQAQNQQFASALSGRTSSPRTQLAMSEPGAINGMQALRSEASVLFNGGQYSAAADAYTRLLQIGSVDASDRYWLGESLYHAGNYQHAAVAFEQAIQLNSKIPQAYVRLTETYLALHLKEKAYQSSLVGLNVVVDPYMKEQLSNLSKAALHQEAKPIRAREVRSHRMPPES
ncbi:MAG TPA: tetratricopeptide repeat protein [Drouetiella sp.]|jgi:tetratricopeptide (TPR) repeat protein